MVRQADTAAPSPGRPLPARAQGVHLLAIGYGSAAAGIYYWIGTQLIVTEITTFLPIAFHQVLPGSPRRGGADISASPAAD